ncbi:MAG: hypothetical protein EOO05_20200, partial [Chitinophagaceae bacterium]
MKLSILMVLLVLLTACQQKKPPEKAGRDTAALITGKVHPEPAAQLHTDTLQYLHFEGNFDYWYAVFIDARKDTLQLVVNDPVPTGYRNKLVEV